MVAKHERTIRQLLLWLILMVGYFIAMLALAVYTRPTASAYPAPQLTNAAPGVAQDLISVNGSAQDSSNANKPAGSIRSYNSKLSTVLNYTSAQTMNQAQAYLAEKAEAEKPKTGVALYDSYVYEIVATKYPSLNPEYIRAIIYHESRYQPNVINKKSNATGLMQILPKWHANRARALGVMDLTDAYGNIVVGCDILNEMTQQRGFEYALNFFAGGYKYADRYTNSKSPFIKELDDILARNLIDTLEE